MKKLLLTLTALAALTTVNAQQEWTNYDFYANANASLTKAPEVVFMGNSITQGWYEKHPEFFSDNNYACRGISGQVTSQMLLRFQADVINLKPRVVVILGGVNDIARNKGYISLQHILENIYSMVELARQNGITPIIASCLPADTIPWNNQIIDTAQQIRALNAALKLYADEHGVKFVDFYSVLATEKGALNPDLTADNLHPTRAGYEVMEPIILEAIHSLPAELPENCAKPTKMQPAPNVRFGNK